MKNLIILFSVILIFNSCKKDVEMIRVQYVITCNNCDVDYYNAKGNLESLKNVTSDWTYYFDAYPGQFVYCYAESFPHAFVHVIIYQNTLVFKSEGESPYHLGVLAYGYLPK